MVSKLDNKQPDSELLVTSNIAQNTSSIIKLEVVTFHVECLSLDLQKH